MTKNMYIAVPDYASDSLIKTINRTNQDGYSLVSVVVAKNKHNCECMYLFFEKEIREEEK